MKKMFILAVPAFLVSAFLFFPKKAEFSSLLSEDVEALSKCEARDGYDLSKHCIESKGSTCYYLGFVADDCISNMV